MVGGSPWLFLVPSLLCEAPLTLKLITRTEQTTAHPLSLARLNSTRVRTTEYPAQGEKRRPRVHYSSRSPDEGETLEDSGANERRSRPGDERRLAGSSARSLLAGLGSPGGRGRVLRVAGRGN